MARQQRKASSTFVFAGARWPRLYQGEEVTAETLKETKPDIGRHILIDRLAAHGLVDGRHTSSNGQVIPIAGGRPFGLGEIRDELVAACEDWKPDLSDDESDAEVDRLAFVRKSKRGKVMIQRMSTKRPQHKSGLDAILWKYEAEDEDVEVAATLPTAVSQAEGTTLPDHTMPRAPRAPRRPVVVEPKVHGTRRRKAEEIEDEDTTEERPVKQPKLDGGEPTAPTTLRHEDEDASPLQPWTSRRISNDTNTSAASVAVAPSASVRPPIRLRLFSKAAREKQVQRGPSWLRDLPDVKHTRETKDRPTTLTTQQDSVSDSKLGSKQGRALLKASFKAPKKRAEGWLSAFADVAQRGSSTAVRSNNAAIRFDYQAAVTITGTSISSDASCAAIKAHRRMANPDIADDDTEDESEE